MFVLSLGTFPAGAFTGKEKRNVEGVSPPEDLAEDQDLKAIISVTLLTCQINSQLSLSSIKDILYNKKHVLLIKFRSLKDV